MHPTKVGAAPVSAGTTPVEAPSRTSENHQTWRHPSTEQSAASVAASHSHRDDGLGAARGLAFAILFDLFLVAFVVAAAFLVGYIAVHVPTAVVILGGLVLVGLVVVRGTASS